MAPLDDGVTQMALTPPLWASVLLTHAPDPVPCKLDVMLVYIPTLGFPNDGHARESRSTFT